MASRSPRLLRGGGDRRALQDRAHDRGASAAPTLTELRRVFLPSRVLALAIAGSDLDRQAERIPILRGKVAFAGRTTTYVCERGTCRLPLTDPGGLARLLATPASD